MIKKSPYEILGLEGDFVFKDIKKAYRKAIREHPPEQNPEKFAMICDAYDRLTNEEYFMQNVEEMHIALDTSLSLEESDDSEKRDNSKYLKEIFEVPFNI